ncbi:MAG: prolipoprotein diacylglyceryl transferase [Lachnospirales bacterium]
MQDFPTIWFPHLNLEFFNIDGVAFSIGGFDAMWYGVLIAIGMLTGYALALWNAERTGFDKTLIDDFLPFAIIFGILGARLYYVIFSWDYYKDNLSSILNLRQGGLAIYGGIIAAVLYGIYFCHKRKVSFFSLADISMPSLLLGQAIGRYGNFINREVYGNYTDNIFAMRILLEDAAITSEEIMNNLVTYMDQVYIQVHPTFFYESSINFCIAIALLIYTKRKRFDGEIFLLGMMGYGFIRFIIEGIRVDRLLIGNTPIAISQLLGISIAIVSLILIFILNKKSKNQVG